ncbi:MULTISPECIES: flavin reductase family protein [Burkholderiaceae]|uniref:flavin reductase family protein n=1 Tax=Burkholderiaceae TaxID=119060 RepID=UPI00141DDF27|nr:MULTISPECIES: flavin reductase family protein [Burkholderiaceae]MBN3845969.1 flavin reductase family protein [Paraburkholderia sp. Ac-20342]NIF54108.1 flavin reductase family protein [Burkholderia sp. Ax-1724]NIF77779.1 flavin reductase family protein [Paraburkholderia sp. Cy-641]
MAETALAKTPVRRIDTLPDCFRQGMRRLAAGVCVLTSDLDGMPVGLTATAVTSLSAEPPRLLACVNRKVSAYTAFEKARALCVNVLSASDVDIARRFAGMVPDVSGPDRFATSMWKGKVPALSGALASFQCHIAEMVQAGTHSILICDVESVVVGEVDTAPLVYAHGQFSALVDDSSVKEKEGNECR